MKRLLTTVFLLMLAQTAAGEVLDTRVQLQQKSTATFYVSVSVGDLAIGDLLVDTGSSYVALNRETFKRLQAVDHPQFVKQLEAVMADGSEAVVPVYRIARLMLGNSCVVRDVEAAVLPSGARNILGMSALQKASPFAISVTPPILTLSECALPFNA